MKNGNPVYPFTALIGQEQMKRALILNAVDPHIGGVLIRGERGTAKSTAARGLAKVLPVQQVISGCVFGCDPKVPAHWCSDCAQKAQDGNEFSVQERFTPFINLPVSATEDRVVGTLDIEKAITEGKKVFDPGVLASANRGILYVDEVNLLDDHVVDLLLDAAAMGMNRVEREGVSYSHPSRFILIGTMNPEEGDLRPQLLDRFAHAVEIRGIESAEDRVEIMKRVIAYEQDPDHFEAEWESQEKALSDRITAARKILSQVRYTNKDLETIAKLTASLKVEGHRADIVILKTAIAQAAFSGRKSISSDDIALAAGLALPHRLQKGPFSEASLSQAELQKRIDVVIPRESTEEKSLEAYSDDCFTEAEKKI